MPEPVRPAPSPPPVDDTPDDDVELEDATARRVLLADANWAMLDHFATVGWVTCVWALVEFSDSAPAWSAALWTGLALLTWLVMPVRIVRVARERSRVASLDGQGARERARKALSEARERLRFSPWPWIVVLALGIAQSGVSLWSGISEWNWDVAGVRGLAGALSGLVMVGGLAGTEIVASWGARSVLDLVDELLATRPAASAPS